MSALKGLLLRTPSLVIGIAPCHVRTLKSTLRVKWVRPTRLPSIHPSNSGDQAPTVKLPPTMLVKAFEDSEELKTADENVKKIFQLDTNNRSSAMQQCIKLMEEKVKRHEYDRSTHEVYIARLTAKIRFLQDYMEKNPKDKKNKVRLYLMVDRRNKQLKHVRRWDYPRFEWLLEKLDIVYRPDPNPYEQVTRKKSVTQLTTILCEEMKEKKLAAFKKQMDVGKVAFLEKKLDRLRWIKSKEEELQLPVTVSEADIEECARLLSQVRLDTADIHDKEYERAIHPFTLEKYHPQELYRAEGRIKDA